MKKYLDKIKVIKSRRFKDGYKYDYYKLVDGNLVINETMNSDRDTFEKFKSNFKVDIPAQISLRSYTNKETNEIEGYVAESKIPENTDYALMEEVYKNAYAKLLELLNVKDIEAFEIYLDEFIFSNGFDFDGIFNENRLKSIVDFYERYNTEEDFKQLLDKIIN